MRAGISQKQPPIVAYSQGTVKQYSDLTDTYECKRSPRVNNSHDSDGFPMKASVEMNSAIRRQKGTTGVDYWKASNSTLSQPCHAKRATFQNVFFPALGMRRFSVAKGDGMVKARSNGTNLKQGLPEFTRAHSTSDMAPPGPGHNPDHRTAGQVRKAVVADMTCLDSGESSNSGKSSQLAYFYQLYRAKFRYMDYIDHHGVDRTAENDMPPKQANAYDEDRTTQPSHPRKPVKLIHSMRTLSIPNIRPSRRGCADVKASGYGTVREPHVRRHDVVSMEVHPRKQPVKHVLSDTVDTQTKKPITKDLTITGTVFSLNHSNPRSHNSTSNSHHGYHSHGTTTGSPHEHSNGHFHGDVGYKHRTVRSASIPRVRLSRGDTDGPRKRSVHFSRSNEVYEYKPTDPVKY